MYSADHNASPFNKLPPLVVALALAIIVPELAFQGGARGLLGGPEGVGWRTSAIERFGFFDQIWEHMVAARDLSPVFLVRFASYPFLHWSLTEAAFGAVLLLAIGNQVAKVFGPIAMALVFVLASAVGAVVFGLINTTQAPLIGAFPAVYGFLGLFTWTLWIVARQTGENPAAAFRLVTILVVLQVAFTLIFGVRSNLASEISGFVIGFLLAPLLVPGGLRRLRSLLQQR